MTAATTPISALGLLIEDVDEDILNAKYGGEEEDYIKDNLNLNNFSWDYITGTEYIRRLVTPSRLSRQT